jgi:magnesium transporter
LEARESSSGSSSITHGTLTWINIKNPTRQDLVKLTERYPFHALNLDDSISKGQLTKIDTCQDYLYILLRFPYFDQDEKALRSSQISFFFSKDYLVMIHDGRFRALSDAFEACAVDPQQRLALMGKSCGYLLYLIIHDLLNGLIQIEDNLMQALDDIEGKVFDESIATVPETTKLRREIAFLVRTVTPLRRTIIELGTKIPNFESDDISAYFSDLKDDVETAQETLGEAKETIEIFKDTDFTLNTQRTNNALAVLTIVFTLTIPASVIASLYGMNVQLPGGIEMGAWTFFGPYTTLILVLLASIVPAALMTLYFRKVRWL